MDFNQDKSETTECGSNSDKYAVFLPDALDNENKDKNGNQSTNELAKALSSEKTCFLCREKDLPDPDCKVCQNIASYYSKHAQNGNDVIDGDVTVGVSFPGPGVVKRNHIYGNYVVASRTIEAGELIISERPLIIGPYCPPEMLPLCLSCCRDIGLSPKCSRCKWPVCGTECEKFFLHAENECKIFAKCGVKSKGILNEYFSVETLRTLLLRDKNTHAWKRILEFEPHIDARCNDFRARAVTDFIIGFIRDKCQLAENFSPEVIDHVVGILSINTFWAFKDLNRYASCLFDKITLFAHDCDPNTDRKLVFRDDDSKGDENFSSTSFKHVSKLALEVTAARKIHPGELITIRYIDVDQPLVKRREELKETFYFECSCSRCLNEIMTQNINENETVIQEKLFETTIC